MGKRGCLLLFVIVLFNFVYFSEESPRNTFYYDREIVIEHFIDNQWKARGNLVFSDIYSKFQYQPINNDNNQLGTSIQKLIEENDFYQIRTVVNKNKYSIASIKACSLASSNFEDKITAVFTENNELIDIDYSTSNPSCTTFNVGDNNLFKTKVEIKYSIKGGVLPEVYYEAEKPQETSQPEKEKKKEENDNAEEEEEDKEKKDPSFFQKYWVTIAVGLVIVNILAMRAQPQTNNNNNNAPRG